MLIAKQTEEQVKETIINITAMLLLSLIQCEIDEQTLFDEISDRMKTDRF